MTSKKVKKQGRPLSITSEKLLAFEQGILLGGNIQQSLAYADIKVSTFYDYKERHPEYSERLEALKHMHIMKAKASVHDRMLDDGKLAMSYLKTYDPEAKNVLVQNNTQINFNDSKIIVKE